MTNPIEIHKHEELLTPAQDKGQALRDEAYGWTKPVVAAAGAALAVGAGLYLLERGVGITALLKGKGLSLSMEAAGTARLSAAPLTENAMQPAAKLGASSEILQSGIFTGKGLAQLEKAGASQPLKSTWDILEERRLFRQGLTPFEEINAANIGKLDASSVRTGNIEAQSFKGVRHSLAKDGTFTSVFENDRTIALKPDGSEHISFLKDSDGITFGRSRNGDFLINGRVSAPAVAREIEPQVIRRPPLEAHEQLIKPWQTPDGNVTVFKDGTVLTQYRFGESALRTPMGIETGMSRGNLVHQTVLDTTTGTETTYFSNGHALQVTNDGSSKFWTPKAFNKPAPGDYFGPNGNLATQDWNTGKYVSTHDTGHRFTLWRQNGLRMEEYTSGAVGFNSPADYRFKMLFSAEGKLVPAGQVDTLSSSLSSISGFDPAARALTRSIVTAEDGSTMTGLSNHLAIRELADGSVQVLRSTPEGMQHILTAKAAGNIAVNPRLTIGKF